MWRAPSLANIRLADGYLRPRQETNHSATLPACLDRCRETGRLDAFRLDWKPGREPVPHIFWDSDVAKVVEGLSLDLMLFPDPQRERELNEYVDLIISAQSPDGYLNTHFTAVNPDKRWSSLAHDHELYCAGHLMEAAAAHHAATGRRNFLDAMVRNAACIASQFGRNPGQRRGIPGHPEIELALMKLFGAAGDGWLADLAAYFVEERGQSPNYFTEEARRNGRWLPELEYMQAHAPAREQTRAVGHAVRALYLYAGMADVAAHTGDRELLDAVRRLWASVTERQMYITGGVGSAAEGERFTNDYHLPADSAYAESCAAIALVFLSHRLLNATGDGRYADIMERALYNAALAGLSLDGTHFFYANPLEVDANTHEHGNIHAERQPFFWCACCPTSYARFLPQMGQYACSIGPGQVALHFPAALEASCPLDANGPNGAAAQQLDFSVESGWPYDGRARLAVREARGEVWLKIRVPDWCRSPVLRLRGEPLDCQPLNGYVTLPHPCRTGDCVELDFPMPVRLLSANPKVTSCAGRVAVSRGPLIYAAEEADNGAGIASLILPETPAFAEIRAPGLPTGTVALRTGAWREADVSEGALYHDRALRRSETDLTLVPSALWGNRGGKAMHIWLRRS